MSMSPIITIGTADGSFDAYFASPKNATGAVPVIVVVQEIFGVNADLRATCDELASQGYIAISPDLFWRQEAGVHLTDQTDAEWQKGMALYQAFDLEAGVADIGATLDSARSLADASGKVGLMGFCLGGLLTFLATSRGEVDASVSYYGGGTEKHLDVAGKIRSPLLMHLGEEDEYILAEARAAIISALADNPFAEIHTYPGCRHAFARHNGAHYDAAAARLANGRTSDFFAKHLR